MTRYEIPLPQVLDSSGNEQRRLNVIDATVNINIMPLSTATVTLPNSEALQMRSWVRMFTSQGGVGVFRVRSPGLGSTNGVTVYQMDHGIVEVGDFIIKEAASETKYRGAANTVISNIWAHYGGSKWQLGTVTPTEKVEYSGDYGNVLSALLDVLGQLPDHMMTFDFSTSPRWTVNIVSRDNTVYGEGRLSRNMRNVRISYDDSNMCTKLYCYETQQEGTHTPPSFVLNADTQSQYGVVEQATGQEENETTAEFRAKCRKYLRQHKNPLVAVNIEGTDLKPTTGEALDGYKIGALYRVALPDYSITVDETLVTLNWPSIYGDPSNVNVTLGNNELSISGVYGGTLSGGGSYGGASSVSSTSKSKSSSKTAHDDHIKRVEMAGILHEAGLEWDENHVLIFANDEATGIGRMYADINVQAGKIDMVASSEEFGEAKRLNKSLFSIHSDSITAEVTRATAAEETANTRITQTADAITAEVTRATQSEGTLSSRITQTATEISTKVSAGDISSTINQTAQSVLIQASKINLSGYVTASQLEATNAKITNLTTGVTTAQALGAYNLSAYTTLMVSGNTASWMYQSVVTSISTNTIQVMDAGGGTATIRYLTSAPSTTTIYYLGRTPS